MILPLFVHEGDANQPIPSMPGVERLSFKNGLLNFVGEARSYGVNQVVIFPKVPRPLIYAAHFSNLRGHDPVFLVSPPWLHATEVFASC
jgi:Delta-aminolevulinic acid dehydratase